MKRTILMTAFLALALCANAQAVGDESKGKKQETKPAWMPDISGTVRAKAEVQTEEGEGRFEVRNARMSLTGKVVDMVGYKAEIDFSDEGSIKMLDAFVNVDPSKEWQFRIGQMRVPFTIDAHRSPHKQFFANRSFIAKQVGNVRDVGAVLQYKMKDAPLSVEVGAFNGSGLTNQKNFWTKNINYSAKASYTLPCGLTFEGSVQKVSPNNHHVYLYDGALSWQYSRWTIEAEYLRKHYSSDAFDNVDAFNSFINYDLPLNKVFSKISFLGRFDVMGDHSDGSAFEADGSGRFALTDAARKRITGGITLSFVKKFEADIRLNYEKYFYNDEALAKPSERDKAVIEFMVHF